jgi:hypothetical protein
MFKQKLGFSCFVHHRATHVRQVIDEDFASMMIGLEMKEHGVGIPLKEVFSKFKDFPSDFG